MSCITCPLKETVNHTHLHNQQHTGCISHQLYIAINYSQTSDRQHTYRTILTNTLNMRKRNLKRANTKVKSQAYKTIVRPQLMHQPSGIHTQQKICTTSIKYKTMLQISWVHHDYTPILASPYEKINYTGLLFSV